MKTLISSWTSDYERSHSSVARIIAQESQIQVIIRGSDFANSSDFRILAVVADILKGNILDLSTIEKVIYEVAKEYTAKKEAKSKPVIFMPALPPDSPEHLKKALDGGLLHEIFHSLYTQRGNPNAAKLLEVMEKYWDPSKIKRVRPFLKILWNVFEDVMIERLGCEKFGGAPPLLQAVHYYVWERELQHPIPKDSPHYVLSQCIGYLRDHCKSLVYLQDIPNYDPDITRYFGKDIIEASQKASNSYDTLDVAFRAAYIILDILDQEEPPEEEDATNGESEEGGTPDTSGEDGGGGLESEEEDKDSEGDDAPSGDGEGDADPDEGSSDSSEEGDSGDAQDTDEDSQEESPQGDSQDDSGEDASADMTLDPQDLSDVIQKAVQKHMEHVFQTGALKDRIIRSPEVKDVMCEVPPIQGAENILEKALRIIKPELARLRPPLVALLENKDRLVRKAYQEQGRSLSSRSLTTITGGGKPRPFELRYQEHAEKSCVLIFLDLSGSMNEIMDTAIAATLATSLVLKSVNIPFAVIGFTSLGYKATNYDPAMYTHNDYLIMQVAKDFHETLSRDVQERIASFKAQAATPLPDIVDVGVKILQGRQEKNKHLFIVSDGAPFYATHVQVDTIHLLKRRLEAAAKQIKPFLLNVDLHNKSTHTIGLPNTQTIRSFQEMPTALMNHLKKGYAK